MASTSAPGPNVSAIDAAREAIAHTKRHLFPFRIERWLVLGVLAFLDQCGRGGGPGLPTSWMHNGAESRWRGDDFPSALRSVPDWLSEHAAAITLGVLLGGLVLAGLLAIVLWINARGSFAYLDTVASGRADLARPWREHAAPASSYFAWRFGLSLAGLLGLLFAGGLVASVMVAVSRGRLAGVGAATAVIALLPVLLLLALGLLLLALAGVALRDFVAPLQLTTGTPCGQAIRVLEGLVVHHPGAFLLYLVLKLALLVGAATAITFVGCLTCCIGFLPVVMQALFQPVFYFERALPLFLLRQMGHDLPGRLGG